MRFESQHNFRYHVETKSTLSIEKYYVDDKIHRLEGPAYIERDLKTGVVIFESYHVNDRLHREDGPALIERKDLFTVEEYYVEGRCHRVDGPAYIQRDSRTYKILHLEYYVENKPL